MTDRPILMSTPMVVAIREDRKTQTRRPVKLTRSIEWLRGDLNHPRTFVDTGFGDGEYLHVYCPEIVVDGHLEHDETMQRLYCPYGVVGDVLWVKETWWDFGEWVPNFTPGEDEGPWAWKGMTQDCYVNGGKRAVVPQYVADQRDPRYLDEYYDAMGRTWDADENKRRKSDGKLHWRLRPSIFMFRWASRLSLRITAIKAERLQKITEEDLRAEGMTLPPTELYPLINTWDKLSRRYSDLWNRLHLGKPGLSWADNPWVWKILFERMKQGHLGR